MEAVAKSHMIMAYLRFYLDEEDSFISAASNSNSNTNFSPCCLPPEVAAYLAYSAMVGGYSLVGGLLLLPDDSAVTPPLSAHHVVDIPKITECSTSL